jgi:hypothetical protein
MADARRDALSKAVARLEIVRPPRTGVEREAIASIALWPWVALVCKHDLSIERLAELAHVSVAELRDPGRRFSQAIANQVAELAYQKAGGGAAMEAALTVEAGHFALLEILARTSPSVSAAIALICQFFPLIHDDVRLVHETRPDGVQRLQFVSPSSYVVHHGYVELMFAVLTLGMRRETEQPAVEPGEVWFEHRAPVDHRRFETVFGPRVRFDMPENHMLFDAHVAALPLARKNSDVHAAAVRAASDLLRS